MNKTININLANMFFHIDEDAYNSLQRYLNAIKRSFTDSQGRDEIISDIEARVAELFSDRIKNERQVIGMKEVEDVIEIMGQPEDYLVDDEIFEDHPKSGGYRHTSSHRKLYRDYDQKFLGGVCAGFAQYFGIDALWVRIVALIFLFALVGTPILVYIILWFIIPKATTTSEKLAMAGKQANITNIEKKIKEGFDDVQERLADVNFDEVGQKAKNGATSFFDSIGDIIVAILKVFAKLFGVIFIITAGAVLIGIIFAAISISFFDFNMIVGNDWFYYQDLGMIDQIPRWVFGLLLLLIFGIPAFVLFILGIRILVKNSKSIGTPAKIILFIVWIGACITATVMTSNALMHRHIEASVNTRAELPIRANDTLNIKMVGNDYYDVRLYRDFNDYEKVYNQNDDVVLYSSAIRLIVKQSESDNARIKVNKTASGVSHQIAKERARNIGYEYDFEDNTLKLNGYFLFDPNTKHNRQKVEITLYLPKGTILYADKNTRSYHRNDSYLGDILDIGQEKQYLKVIDNDLICLDCPSDIKKLKKEEEEEYEENKVIINSDGININVSDDDDKVNVKIDSDGVKVKSEKKDNN
jgi:phage shock protein PspC (stress-responsive transcriptional regulator)